jgi:signal transduction histidine kinase
MTAEPLYTAGGEIEGLTMAAVDVTEQRQLEAEMQRSAMRIQMQHYLTNQRELERMQIARDLHDGPLQDLIAITFDMQAVIDEAEGTPLSEYLLQIQNELQHQIASLRSFSYELRPPMLNNFSLERTIRAHAEGFMLRSTPAFKYIWISNQTIKKGCRTQCELPYSVSTRKH